MSDVPRHLARNLRTLRERRGWTQARLGEQAGVPRATLATVESGSGNPTLAVVVKLADALQVSLEELIGPPRADVTHVAAADVRTRTRGGVQVRQLVPTTMRHLEVERLSIPVGRTMVGVPHTSGTQELLTCERGVIELTLTGQTHRVEAGDVLQFRGDQRHSYHNPGPDEAVGYSVVALTPRE